MAGNPSISVVFPAYNESARVDAALDDALAYLGKRSEEWEIVVVDDGSRDDTAARVEARARREPRIRIVRLGRNEGKGGAVREGMLRARGRWRLFRDADNSTRMEEFDKFLPLLEAGADVVIASRRIPGSQFEERQPPLRELLGRGFALLCRLLFVWEVRDFTCGFKCFRAEAVEPVFSRQRTRRWAFDAEILFIAHRLGLRIEQVPVRWRNDPGTKVRLLVDVARSVREILQVRLNDLLGLYRFDRP